MKFTTHRRSKRLGAVLAALLTAGTLAVTAGEAAAQSSRGSGIYQNSEGFDFLATPGTVVPGGKYTTSSGSSCSFGWLVYSKTDTAKRKFMLTAGHCGKKGERVYIQGSNGKKAQVGQFVESTGGILSNGDDYALIDVTNSPREAQLPLSNPDFDGWKTQQWVKENNPKICRLGFRTGVSCGPYQEMKNHTIFYRGISDHGDSGGPVWAETRSGKRYAVGVTSYGYDSDATLAGAASITPYMNKYSLGIYTS